MRKVVLVVDDDEGIRSMVEEVLRAEGHAVVCARDGEEGLRLLRQVVPTLILLDNAMPRLNGPAFRAAISAEPKLASVPIVSISGASTRDGGRVLGKPFSLDALIDIVRRYCAA